MAIEENGSFNCRARTRMLGSNRLRSGDGRDSGFVLPDKQLLGSYTVSPSETPKRVGADAPTLSLKLTKMRRRQATTDRRALLRQPSSLTQREKCRSGHDQARSAHLGARVARATDSPAAIAAQGIGRSTARAAVRHAPQSKTIRIRARGGLFRPLRGPKPAIRRSKPTWMRRKVALLSREKPRGCEPTLALLWLRC
jgi:hypothetical protein